MFRLSQLSSSSGFYSSSSHTIDHDAITQHDPTRIQNLLFSSSSLNNPHGLSLTPLLFGGEGGGSVHEQPSNHPPLDDGNANDFLHPIHQQQLNPQQPSHLDVNTTTTTTSTQRIEFPILILFRVIP
ncbi:hypothetical protein C9374_003114 [Naegleria lovaniensis]|uniref:Uncharacterized protein n=1 Tax=Naegleria lovaniensis TaxID=51637 RepID=A0AA88GSC2_NAELO|nr:uncharacterized protein C9374_003114 [Naegleria lovaniensis]KAG2385965.1 hypothetical protein C9374_003114 [Naegleria lovaniensis]